ncbi:ferrous iron transport protein A [soil metagenome]
MTDSPAGTLAAAPIGTRARIVELSGEDSLVQRLLEMGLTEGEEIEVVRHAPLGDPIEIHIRGYNLSLRRSEATSVIIETL